MQNNGNKEGNKKKKKSNDEVKSLVERDVYKNEEVAQILEFLKFQISFTQKHVLNLLPT